ncbi:MAG: kelch repeat-containing protein [Bdellovibrionota bacterium]|jgi:hypothetical protein
MFLLRRYSKSVDRCKIAERYLSFATIKIDFKFRPHLYNLFLSLLFTLLTIFANNQICSAETINLSKWFSTGAIGERSAHSATLLPSGEVLVVGGVDNFGTVLNTTLLYSPSTNSWTAGAPISTARKNHAALLLKTGDVLISGGLGYSGSALSSAEIYNPRTGSWLATNNSMAIPRASHTMTLLKNGTVLICGGLDSQATEIYNPNQKRFSGTTCPLPEDGQSAELSTSREKHTATLLTDGRVLVCGGEDSEGNDLDSTEIYDPISDCWSAGASLQLPRSGHTATTLPNGKVVVVGNYQWSEIYTPSSGLGSWSEAGEVNNDRKYHAATLLPNGRIIVLGGENATAPYLDNAEIYTPSQNRWTLLADTTLSQARSNLTLTVLPDGTLLTVGGDNGTPLAVAERLRYLSDETNIASSEQRLKAPRLNHASVLLANGKILLSGGRNASGTVLTSSEIYDTALTKSTAVADMLSPRQNHTLTLLPDGRVLAVGGESDLNGTLLSSAEIYNPNNNTWESCSGLESTVNGTARTKHSAILLDSNKVLIVGGQSAITPAAIESDVTQLYDYITDSWQESGSLNTARYGHTTTLLSNGHVLVAGGYNTTTDTYLSNAEDYNPTDDLWTSSAIQVARTNHSATTLLNDTLLLIGGKNSSGRLNSAEIYNGTSWTTVTETLTNARDGHTATLLPDGRVVVIGGQSSDSAALKSTEIFDPLAEDFSAGPSLSATKSAHTAHFSPHNSIVLLGGWNLTTIAANNSVEFFQANYLSSNSQRPIITTSTLLNGLRVNLSGENFIGSSEASGSGNNTSATNYPLAQVRSLLHKDYRTFLTPNPSSPWSDTTYYTLTVPPAIPIGPALITVYSHGVTSTAKPIMIDAPLDHFSIRTAISGTAIGAQEAGVPFYIQITAENEENETLTTFSEKVTISSNCALSEDTENEVALAAGTLASTKITLTSAAEDCTITVRSGTTESESNAFEVSHTNLEKFLIETAGTGGNITEKSTDNVFSIQVTALDKYDNRVTTFNGTVNIGSNKTLREGEGVSNAFVNGFLARHDIAFSSVGDTHISATGKESAESAEKTSNSNTFNVTHGNINNLLVEAHGGGDVAAQIAGVDFGITITARDSYNNTATSFTGTVNLSSNIGSLAGGGGITPNFTAGVLTNHKLNIETALDGYIISATEALSGSSGTTNQFNVTHAPLYRFLIEKKHGGNISDHYAGEVFPIQITALDEFENIVKSFNGTTTISSTGNLLSGAGATANFVNGFLAEHNVSLSLAGISVIIATDEVTGRNGRSNDITIIHTALHHFRIEGEVTGNILEQTAGVPFRIKIRALDIFNNTVRSFNGTTEISISEGAIQEGGGTTPPLTNGELLHTIKLTKAGTFSLLAKNSVGEEVGPSNNFDVVHTTLDHFTLVHAAGGEIGLQTAGTPFNVKITAYDVYNNLANRFNGTVNITSDISEVVSGKVSAPFTNGVLSSHAVTLTLAGQHILTARYSNGTQSGVSNQFRVQAATVGYFRIENIVGGFIPTQLIKKDFAIKITAFDRYNNLVDHFQESVEVSVSGATARRGTGTTQPFLNGILSEHIIRLRNSGVVTITAQHVTSGASGVSNNFAVINEVAQPDRGRKVTFNVKITEDRVGIPNALVCGGELGCRNTDSTGTVIFKNSIKNWNYIFRMQKYTYNMEKPKVTLTAEISENFFTFKGEKTRDSALNNCTNLRDMTAERIILGNSLADLYSSSRRVLGILLRRGKHKTTFKRQIGNQRLKAYLTFQDAYDESFQLPILETTVCNPNKCSEKYLRNLKREFRKNSERLRRLTTAGINLGKKHGVSLNVKGQKEVRALRKKLRSVKQVLTRFSDVIEVCE